MAKKPRVGENITVDYEENVIILENVILSYPHVFEPRENESDSGKKTYRYTADFILPLDTHEEAVEIIEDEINKLIEKEFEGGKVPRAKWCLKDGNDKEGDEYQDTFVVSASEQKRPAVVDVDPTVPLQEGDDKIYGGCVVNAVIRLWAMNGKSQKKKNPYGKRISANLISIQFVDEGERFGDGTGGRPKATDTFKKLGDSKGKRRRDEEEDDDDDGSARTRRAGKRPDRDEDDGRSKRKSRPRDEDEEEEEEEPRKKRRARDEEDEEEEAPRKKKRPARDEEDDDDEDEPPRKKRRPRDEEDED